MKGSAAVVLLSADDCWSWSLFDVSGKVVQQEERIEGARLRIDTLGLSSGVYLYLVRTAAGKSYTGKLSVY